MIVGNRDKFAIESHISQAYSNLHFRALGFFVIYITGKCYGVRSVDATMLTCSFEKVKDRLGRRGRHLVPFATELDPGKIVDEFRDAVYAPDQDERLFFGIPHPEYLTLVRNSHMVWAPDGDEAFDDWSYVLQFDVGSNVRLIGFRSLAEGYHHDPETLSDLILDAEEFYSILQQWLEGFEKEWEASDKITVIDDGTTRG